MPQRSAPNTLTNAICKKCNEVTTHQHGDCIACTRFGLDPRCFSGTRHAKERGWDVVPQWTLNDEHRIDINENANRTRSEARMVELGYDLDELDEVNPFTQYGDGIYAT